MKLSEELLNYKKENKLKLLELSEQLKITKPTLIKLLKGGDVSKLVVAKIDIFFGRTYPNLLVHYRAKNNLSLEQTAKNIGVSKDYLKRIETGKGSDSINKKIKNFLEKEI